jgi:hypothetical protein
MTRQYVPVSKKRNTFPTGRFRLFQERREGEVCSSHLEIKIAWGNNNQRRPHVVGREGMSR